MSMQSGTMSMVQGEPVARLLQFAIEPKQFDDIFGIMTTVAEDSRKEQGCTIRYDLLCDKGNPGALYAYEVFASSDAFDEHKTKPTKPWDGKYEPTIVELDAINFQKNQRSCTTLTPICVVLQVEIKEEHVAEFTNMMTINCMEARKEEGCLRFDFLQNKDDHCKFITYEVFESMDAVNKHKNMPYAKAWDNFEHSEKQPIITKTVSNLDAINFQVPKKSVIEQLLDPSHCMPEVRSEADSLTESFISRHSFAPGHGSSTAVTALILVKTFLTGTILVVPNGFKLSGLAGGIFVVTFIGIIEVYCMDLLVQCRTREGQGGYCDLARHLGRYGPTCASMMLVLSQYGFLCAEQIYVAENTLKVTQPSMPWLEEWHLLFFFQLVLIPMSFTRKLRTFAITNLIADIVTIGCVAYLLSFGVLRLASEGVSHEVIAFSGPGNTLVFMGTCVYVYEGINVVLPIYEAHEDKKNFSCVLSTVLAVLTVVFIIFGTVWYCLFGPEAAGVAPMNLPNGSLEASLIPPLYALGCLFTTPILLFPITQVLEPLIFDETWHRVGQRKWAKNAFRCFLMLSSACVAAVGGKNLQRFLSIIGGFCCGPLAFLFPSMLHLKIVQPSGWRYIVDLVLVVIGVAVTILTTTMAIFG